MGIPSDFPAHFPAHLPIASVYAGLARNKLFYGNYSLLLSLKQGSPSPIAENHPAVRVRLHHGRSNGPTPELCRQHGITEQTYYRWKAKYGFVRPRQ